MSDIWRNLSRHQFIGRTEELHLAGDYADMDEWAEDQDRAAEVYGGNSKNRYRPAKPGNMRPIAGRDTARFYDPAIGSWVN